jgi:hypothetical protein
MLSRFIYWQIKQARHFMPKGKRRWADWEKELRLKELRTMGFFLCLTLAATVTDAVLSRK